MRSLIPVWGVAALCLFSQAWAGAGALHRGLGPEPDSLDIHHAQGLAAIQVLRDLREGLVTFDAAGELVPGVAESWEVSADGLLYRFRLRQDARWSDGRPLTADHFVAAWRRALGSDQPARTASLLRDVAGVVPVMSGDAPSDELGIRAAAADLLEVRLERPVPWFLELMTHPVSFPLHPDAMAPGAPDGGPVNGPFVLNERVPNGHIRLLPNPHYHDTDSVRVRSVTWYPIEDATSELARFRAGELDVTETIPPGRYAWLADRLPEALRIHPYLGSFWLGLNLRQPELQRSADLRRALALAIDRDILVRHVLGAGEQPAYEIVPPSLLPPEGNRPLLGDATQAERSALARELYRRSGAPDGLLLELRYNSSSVHRRMAVAVAAMWKQVLGVNTDLVQEEWRVFVNNRRQGVVTEVFRGGWIADFADPVSFLDLFRSDNELNVTFYRSDEYDRLLAAAAGVDGPERLDRLRAAERRLLQDMPAIPLYHYVSRHLVQPWVSGWQDNVRDVHLSRWLGTANGAPESTATSE